MIKDDFKQKLLICPYCPPKNRLSHRTACYKVKQTSSGKIVLRCVACGKIIKANISGDFIIKEEIMQVIKDGFKYEKKTKKVRQ